MAYQDQFKAYLALVKQSAFGTAANGSTATTVLPINRANLRLSRAPVVNGNLRLDGLPTLGRQGQNTFNYTFSTDLTAGTFENLLESLMRRAKVTEVSLSGTFLGKVIVTPKTNTSVIYYGPTDVTYVSLLSSGVTVGDVVSFGSGLGAGDNGKYFAIKTISAGSSVTQASGLGAITGITVGGVITFTSGTVSSLFSVGQVIYFKSGPSSGSNINVMWKITAVNDGGKTITVNATPVAQGTSIANYEIYIADNFEVQEVLQTVYPASTISNMTRVAKLHAPAYNNMTDDYYTLEEYEQGIDASTVLQDCIITKVNFSVQPDQNVKATFTIMGTGKVVQQAIGVSAPYFTSITIPAAEKPFTCTDCSFSISGTPYSNITSFTLDVDINAVVPKVCGATYAPTIGTGTMTVSMNLSLLRSDTSFNTLFQNETVNSFNLFMKYVPLSGTGYKVLNIFVPRFTLGSVDPSSLSKDGGIRTDTINVPAELIGAALSSQNCDVTPIKFSYVP